MDQFVGASGEQLTFAVYWLIWGALATVFFAKIGIFLILREDDYPSRIDLGKDKYGGLFTVEEVEDVKTF